MTKLLRFTQLSLKVGGWLAIGSFAASAALAQTPAPRIRAEISSSTVSTLKGSLHPLAQTRFDSGRMPGDAPMSGMSVFFSRSAAQQADLDALLAAQQDPNSPRYHQWLTPDQFAARFGMAQSDIDKVQSWLEQQGFSIDSVARSRNMIRFSGRASQVEQAFQTQMHYFTVAGAKHFAPSTELTIPAALSSVIASVRNLDDFRPRPMIQTSRVSRVNPAFTSNVSGNVFFSPGDIKVAYGVNSLINAGDTGTGQSIVVVGQSSISKSDIEAFQNANQFTVKDPTQILVPGSGNPQAFQGDQGESDLDLEWTSGMAPGAQIYFVYTGDGTGFGVFDSILYAIDEKLGNIISVSYGQCEPEITPTNISALDAVLQQAAAQGQSIVAASGDSGSSACYVAPPTTQNALPPLGTQEQLAVSYPASSQYVTGVGGTEITSANDAAGNQYWAAKGSTDQINSLLTYIPEVAWNDDATAVNAGANSLSATGGGVSTIYTTSPSWQKGVPGIPTTPGRYVPDVSLYASPDLPGFLYCTSDSSDWVQGQVSSCTSGFRDSTTSDLTIAGGTSFSAPIFAGMVAILNQSKGYVTGTGLLNPTLYTIAASTNYATAFNDITTGDNKCPTTLGALESQFCSAPSSANYSTNVGYDPVTGLGSVNLSALVSVWPASTSTLIGTTTSLSAANPSPNTGTSDVITILVAPTTGSTTPTGSITLSVDGSGTSFGTGTTTTLTLGSGGTATYTANFATAGIHTIVAQYGGDSTHGASTGSISIPVGGASSGKGTITLGATNLTVSRGSTGTSTITVTPAGGYTGTVYLTFSTSNNTALSNLCYAFSNTLSSGQGSIAVTGTTPVTTQLTFDTNATDCASAAVRSGGHAMHRLGTATTSQNHAPKANPAPLSLAFAGLLLAGVIGRRSRKLRGVSALAALLALGFGLSACSSGSSTSVSNPSKGTYTVTLTGQDSATTTINATTTFTFVIN